MMEVREVESEKERLYIDGEELDAFTYKPAFNVLIFLFSESGAIRKVKAQRFQDMPFKGGMICDGLHILNGKLLGSCLHVLVGHDLQGAALHADKYRIRFSIHHQVHRWPHAWTLEDYVTTFNKLATAGGMPQVEWDRVDFDKARPVEQRIGSSLSFEIEHSDGPLA